MGNLMDRLSHKNSKLIEMQTEQSNSAFEIHQTQFDNSLAVSCLTVYASDHQTFLSYYLSHSQLSQMNNPKSHLVTASGLYSGMFEWWQLSSSDSCMNQKCGSEIWKVKNHAFCPDAPCTPTADKGKFSQQLLFGKWEKRRYTKSNWSMAFMEYNKADIVKSHFLGKKKDSQLGTIIFPQKNACVKKIQIPWRVLHLILGGHIWSSYWRIYLSWLHITYKTHLMLTEM